ncbi:MAG: dTDP-4-dehydrorhamnose 3,5-epimerase [Pseudomonadota bacterium]
MDVIETAIPEVKKLIPRRFGDNRGWFTESYNKDRLAEAGITADFVQDNHSFSADIGTVRGLHFQAPPHAQGKLVRVTRGRVLDVAVDIRKGSPTFGAWVSEELTGEGGEQLWVPRGFLHGFVTLTPDVELLYKVDAYYSPEADGAVRFDDPDIGIDWQVDTSQAVLSGKDAAAPWFRDFETPFV